VLALRGTSGLRRGGGRWHPWLLVLFLAACGARVPKGNRTHSVALENGQPGTHGWRLDRPASAHEVEGYALRQTVFPGEALHVAISVSDAPAVVRWEAFRIGWYAGALARSIASGEVLATTQPPCPMQSDGLVACSWEPTATLQIDDGFAPGVYVLVLTREDGFGSYVPFIVRSRNMRPDVLALIPTTTWAAYNEWGGASLYTAPVGATRSGHADRVSFDRPNARGNGAASLMNVEFWAINWLEAEDLEVSYAAIEDVDREPALIRDANAVVVTGHDEYWTHAVRDALDEGVNTDVSLLSLGANVGYWQVRLEAALDGRDRRTVVCFKEDAPGHDPVGKTSPELTVEFRQRPVSEPERKLFGEQYEDRFGLLDMPLVVSSIEAWPFRDTGFRPGDTVLQGTGYEIDTVGHASSAAGITVLTDSPFLSVINAAGRGQMSIHPVPGGWVFDSGSADFSRLLADPEVADARIRRLVTKVLDAAIERPPEKVDLGLPDAATNAVPPIWSPARDVSVWAGTPGKRGDRLGPRLEARLQAPLALAAGKNGALWVGDVGNHRLIKIGNDGAATAPGELAAVKLPQALAVGPDDTLYVLDGTNGKIWRRKPSKALDVLATVPLGRGLVVSPDGNVLYVADTWGGSLLAIHLHGPSQVPQTVLAGLDHPTGLAISSDGVLYVQETGARILRVVDGRAEVVAGSGSKGFRDGPAADARFLSQDGIAVLPDGSLVVSDPGNYRLRRIANGVVTTLAGTGRAGTSNGPGNSADLVMPTGLAVAPGGQLWVAETGNGSIRVVAP